MKNKSAKQLGLNMHKFIQWPKCVSVVVICLLTWGISGTGSCPADFDCSGPDCYLIYPKNGDWKYKDPKGNTHNADGNVYKNPNCYQFIRRLSNKRSCIDAQRECELVNGNITVINSVKEYDQLTENVLHVLKHGTGSKFNVHVHRLPQKNLNKGCAIINVYDGTLSNDVNSKNIDCSKTDMVNTIICESTDISPEICPVRSPTTPRSVSTTSLLKASPVMLTSSRNILSTNTSDYTVSSTKNMASSDFNSGNEPGDDILVIICVPLVVIILIIIVAFFVIRWKKKRITSDSNYAKGGRVSYSNGVLIDAHSDEFTENAAMSPPGNQNDVAPNVYDVPPNVYDVPPNVYDVANQKKHNVQDSSEAYDSLNASDMPPDTETDADVTYGNTEFLRNGGEFYDSINAAEMQSYTVGNDNEGVPYGNTSKAYYANSTDMTSDYTKGDKRSEVYSTANEEALNNDFGNEYGKLDIDTPSHKYDMYSYVDTSINTSPKDPTYDRLQRNK